MEFDGVITFVDTIKRCFDRSNGETYIDINEDLHNIFADFKIELSRNVISLNKTNFEEYKEFVENNFEKVRYLIKNKDITKYLVLYNIPFEKKSSNYSELIRLLNENRNENVSIGSASFFEEKTEDLYFEYVQHMTYNYFFQAEAYYHEKIVSLENIPSKPQKIKTEFTRDELIYLIKIFIESKHCNVDYKKTLYDFMAANFETKLMKDLSVSAIKNTYEKPAELADMEKLKLIVENLLDKIEKDIKDFYR
jgi:hypothetical protein